MRKQICITAIVIAVLAAIATTLFASPVTVVIRRGTSAQWLSANPILANGEPGYETDSGGLKIGNGTSTWSGLGYFIGGTDSGKVPMSTFANYTSVDRLPSSVFNTAMASLPSLSTANTFTQPQMMADIITGGPRVDIRWFAASVSGGDWQPAMAAAQSYAQSVGGVVYLPHGTYTFNSGFSYLAPIVGDGSTQSILVANFSTGYPLISINGIQRWKISGVKITSASGSLQNYVGIQTYGSAGRFFTSDVYVAYAATGISINSWIGEMQNVWLYGCTTGLYGTQLNGANLQIFAEGNGTGVWLDQSSGTTIRGTIEGNTTTGVLIDNNSWGVDINAYMEGNPTHLIVGQTTGTSAQCFDINVIGGKYVSSAGGIQANNVNGFKIAKGSYISCPVQTTSSTLNYASEWVPHEVGATGSQAQVFRVDNQDSSLSVKRLQNLFPNPTFRGGLKGYKSTAITRATVAPETTIVRDETAIRVTSASGQTNCYASLTLPDAITSLANGKTIVVSGWVWVPNLPGYQGTSPASIPDVVIQFTDSGNVTTGTGTKTWKEGQWNFFVRKIPVTATASNLTVQLYSNRGGAVDAEGDYIVVADVFVGIYPGNLSDMMMGRWANHPFAGGWVGQNWIGYGTAAPTDANQTYAAGDRVVNSALTATTAKGWACVNSGSPGTWIDEGVVAGTTSTPQFAGLTLNGFNATNTFTSNPSFSGTVYNWIVNGVVEESLSSSGTKTVNGNLQTVGGTVRPSGGTTTLTLNDNTISNANWSAVQIAHTTNTQSSGAANVGGEVNPTISQTGTAGYTFLQIDPTIISKGSGVYKLASFGETVNGTYTEYWGLSEYGNVKSSVGTPVASATSITPTGDIFHVSGTAAISTINLPLAGSASYAGYTGCIRIIPDGAWTTTSGGNIALASTAVVGKVLEMCFDGSEWYPSY